MSKDTNKKEKNMQNESFVKGVRAELKKVTWPTGKELFNSTATVLFLSLLIAVIVFVLDFAFEKANTYGIEGLKTVVSSEENTTESDETTEESTDDVDAEVTDETETTDSTTEENTDNSEEVTSDTENSENAEADTTSDTAENAQ